jgi:hypothetical protein
LFYQCQFRAEQLVAKEEIRRKAIAEEQEKQVQFAKAPPYIATFICGIDDDHLRYLRLFT